MAEQPDHWEPVEIITADGGVRVCVFRDPDGTYAFELQRRDIYGDAAGSRYVEHWNNVTGSALRELDVPNSYRLDLPNLGEALVRAATTLAVLVERANTFETADRERAAVGDVVWVRVFGLIMRGTVGRFDSGGTVVVNARGLGGTIQSASEVYATKQAAEDW